MSDQSLGQGDTGSSDHEQHRAGPNEGVRAPLSRDSGGPPQISVFDGKGNEEVVVLTENEEGKTPQGAAPPAGRPLAAAKDPGAPRGEGCGPGGNRGYGAARPAAPPAARRR